MSETTTSKIWQGVNHSNIEEICFPVKQVESNTFCKDNFYFSRKGEFSVIGQPTKQEWSDDPNTPTAIFGSFTKLYNLTSNKDFFLPVVNHIQKVYGDSAKVVIQSSEMERFYVTITIEDEGLKKNFNGDIMYPSIYMMNSYDGWVSRWNEIGYFRTICSNGLRIVGQEVYKTRKRKHSGEFNVEVEIKRMMEELQNLDKKTAWIEELMSVEIKEQKVEELQEIYTNQTEFRFPKKKVDYAFEIAKEESKELGRGYVSAFDVWMGINNVLNHDAGLMNPKDTLVSEIKFLKHFEKQLKTL